MSKIICKVIQRRFYDVLSSRHVFILFVTIFVLFLLCFSVIFEEIVVNWRPNTSVHVLVRYRNNIGGKSYEQDLCQYLPIDAVYTWVNGSDPLLVEQLSFESNEWLRKYNISSNYVREVCANKSDNFYLQMPLVFVESFEKFALPFLNATKLETLSTAHNNEIAGNLLYFKDIKEAHISTNITLLIGNDYLLSKLKNGVQEAVSAKRFADNEELRFSLRSLEKFAPWIRNVFIVTNGQIPHWLNLRNPKVKVITHQQIFANKRHLPTFNSAAIELNLHRIPGLSQKFIYFNDDIFLAKPIFPEDFFTQSSGHKVYLSWPVPNCEPNCPLNWIKDGFCDTVCNTSSCSWDGGDCLFNASSGVAMRGPHAAQLSHNFEQTDNCHHSCPNNWLADKFCDNVCNVEECAFDLGDCGTDDYHKLSGSAYDENELFYYFPTTKSIFLNLTNLVKISDLSLEKAEYEKNEQIRAMAINLKDKLLTVLLYNATETNVTLAFTYKLHSNESINKNINLIIGKQRKSQDVRKIHRATDKSLKMLLNENSTPIPITFRTYPSSQEKPKILDDYKAVFNQSLDAFEDNNQTLNQYSDETKKKMALIERQRREGYLTEKGFFYEKYKAFMSHNHRGSFPWEQTALFQRIGELIENYEQYSSKSQQVDRHLMDIFADSLRYVNKLYNEQFGVQIRKVPSHSAHLIDISVMQRFQEMFAEQVDKTCSHKLRSSQDMQFAFSYYYFLMSETKTVNVSEMMHRFDTDYSGTLSHNEMKTLRLHLQDWSLSATQFESFTHDCFDSFSHKTNVEIAIKDILSCEKLTEHISKHYAPVKMNSYQVVDDGDVAFKMVRSNASIFHQELNELRRKPKKFICFNDDIDHNLSNESQLVKSLLREFYESIVPKRSQFELPDGQRNEFTYIHEYIELQSTSLFTLQRITFFVLLILSFSCLALKKCKTLVNKLRLKKKYIKRNTHYL
ncbi:N-acetylglucosamine-1-phosphotransferase subunits alpha/beta-like isoform X1 [Leptotrombidium deliense]|uniref:N-acetylglucosamine-1-phosphotransferase subunits alpha/beta-like isoform X1 n=1 Tax=Leptotrombidium deliense TaxID=299467 RepID=A0A443SUT0_9ACAR|nr:N-acetylglucosamine-1-phosphotransferase subunits alpha/beta-like isoform X1 [Leptotrombidium deliense]